ncbi:MAG: phosphoribosylamine--glycine ligase, partial [Noviherbaspirillum sp.]
MGTVFLVVGHEGRDHAIARKLAQSPRVELVYVATGNRAMPFDSKLFRLPDWSHEGTADFVAENNIACTIVGDTSDMQSGFVDVFLERGLPILGATQAAAMLEGSKSFAKDFMLRHRVPTARHRMCDNPADIDDFLSGCSYPVVLKADLRVSSQNSAKIIHDPAEAARACKEIFDAQNDKFDDEPAQVLLEEFISGKETSYTILMDGEHWTPLVAVRDYKRLYDGDAGCNTGGMGSYAPVPWLTRDINDRIATKVIEPTLRGMREEGLSYRGFLYFGIMVDARGEPWVLEYNTRLGDTEAETILTLWDDDLAQVALQATTGSIASLTLNWRKGWAVSIAIAPHGYPGGTIDKARIML